MKVLIKCINSIIALVLLSIAAIEVIKTDFSGGLIFMIIAIVGFVLNIEELIRAQHQREKND